MWESSRVGSEAHRRREADRAIGAVHVYVTRQDERKWLMHVAGFRDPDSPRARRYAVAWNIRDKIRAALIEAARRGRSRDSIFQRWEHASW